MTESAAKKAAEPFRYKPKAKLEPSEPMFEQMVQLGMLRVNQHTAAAVLGCSTDTLQRFWTSNPEYREAYDAGQQLDNVRTSRLLRMHAVSDPATARFLAKNYLELSDDPSKARLDEESTKALKSRTPEETRARIQEMLGKLKVIEGDVSHGTWKDERKQGRPDGVQSDGSVHAGDGQGVSPVRPAGRAGAPQAQGRQVLQRPVQEGLAQPEEGEGGKAGGKVGGRDVGKNVGLPRASAGQETGKNSGSEVVQRLEKRLLELEASAVRKNPRKDGQPHTDRTTLGTSPRAGSAPAQPVDKPTNKPQEGRPYAPARLPGRIGGR